MSIHASLDFSIEDLDIRNILQYLQSENWSPEVEGEITYLDNDDYDWKIASCNKLEVIINTLILSECVVVGIVLVNQDLKSGGGFLFFKQNHTLSIMLSINRIVHESGNTDFQTYINRLKKLYLSCSMITFSELK